MKNNDRSLCFSGWRSKLLLMSLLCVCGLSAYGQGTVFFSNFGAPGAITDSLTGQRAEVGTTLSVSLYFAADGVTDESKFTQVGPTLNIGVVDGTADPNLAGRFDYNGTVTAPIVPPGGFAMFQVRAWETMFGATYEAAVANASPLNGRLALAGESGIMRVKTGNPTLVEPEVPTYLAAGPPRVVAVVGAPLSDGFVLRVVPEPGSILLLVLGAPAIFRLSFRRRK